MSAVVLSARPARSTRSARPNTVSAKLSQYNASSRSDSCAPRRSAEPGGEGQGRGQGQRREEQRQQRGGGGGCVRRFLSREQQRQQQWAGACSSAEAHHTHLQLQRLLVLLQLAHQRLEHARDLGHTLAPGDVQALQAGQAGRQAGKEARRQSGGMRAAAD